jgi:hypothetical protein
VRYFGLTNRGVASLGRAPPRLCCNRAHYIFIFSEPSVEMPLIRKFAPRAFNRVRKHLRNSIAWAGRLVVFSRASESTRHRLECGRLRRCESPEQLAVQRHEKGEPDAGPATGSSHLRRGEPAEPSATPAFAVQYVATAPCAIYHRLTSDQR